MGDIDNSSSFLCEAHFDMIFQAHAIELMREIALKTHWWLAGDHRVAVRIFEGKKKEKDDNKIYESKFEGGVFQKK